MKHQLVEQLLERVSELVETTIGKWVVLDCDDGIVEGYVSAIGHSGESYWVQLDDDEQIGVTAGDLAVMLVKDPAVIDVETRVPARLRPTRRAMIDVHLPGD